MRVGIYLGGESDNTENIEKQLIAWSEYLSDHEVDAFGAAELPNSVQDSMKYFRTSKYINSNPIKKILTSFRNTIEYINKRDPDIVIQIWCYPTHGPGVSLAATYTKTPSIIRFSGDHFNEFESYVGINKYLAFGLDNLIGRVPLQLADSVITLGPYGRDEVIRRGADRTNVAILPPSKGQEPRFTPIANKEKLRQELGIPVDHQIALYVGRLTKRKGMPFLLQVMKEMETQDKITFVLVGAGEFEEKFSRPNFDIQLPGYVSYQEVHKYFQSADLYVHPSKYEGIPQTILEALNCGVPVIARDAGDIKYLIDDVVVTPSQMAAKIRNENYEFVWKNKNKFTKQWQENCLQNVLVDTVYGDN